MQPNPYQTPKSSVGDAPLDVPWLRPELRNALLIPPLLIGPVALVFVSVGKLFDVHHDFSLAGHGLLWLLAVVAGAYAVQFTYGVGCYALLRRFRMLNFPAILAASLLPVVGGLGMNADARASVITIAMYGSFGLVVGASSWFFVSRDDRRAL